MAWFCIAIMAVACIGAGLPADGWVRAGRYFPVAVRADGGPVTVAAEGCVPTDVAGGFRGVVPVLAVGPTFGTVDGRPLRVPADGDRLVGTATGDVPAGLFPGERAVVVPLDGADPVPGPAAAWEVLDAVVLDRAAMDRLSDGQRSALLAGGVVLATTGNRRPDDRWPWTRRGSAWVLAYAPAGPTGVVGGDVFGPADLWRPAWPAGVRWGVAAVGLVVTLVMVAVLAGGGRAWRPAVAVGVAGLAGVGVWVWRAAALDPVAVGGGDVTVVSPAWVQRDRWAYGQPRWAATVVVPWAGWTHPAFASAAMAAGARLAVGRDGSLSYRVPTGAGAVVGFVRREVGPSHGTTVDVTGDQGGVMRSLTGAYLSAGDRVLGQTPPAAPGRWPGVAVGRR